MTFTITHSENYTEIFAQRGQAYHRAMQNHPLVRHKELASVIEYADLVPGMRVLDCPSGGGYLYPYCPAGTKLIEADTAFSLAHQNPTERLPIDQMDKLPLPDASMDRVISLAGIHHQPHRDRLFAEWARVLKPGGILALADVWQGSNTGKFLNGFVHNHNPMGHVGDFLTSRDLDYILQAGFTVTKMADKQVNWCFASAEEAWHYMSELFYLTQCPNQDNFMLGLTEAFELEKSDSQLLLPWTLRYIQAQKHC